MSRCGRCRRVLGAAEFALKTLADGTEVPTKTCKCCLQDLRRNHNKPLSKLAKLQRERSGKVKEKRKKYSKSKNGKLVQKRANAKRADVQNERRRSNGGERMRSALATKLSVMYSGKYSSQTVTTLTDFASVADVQAHFASRLSDGMTTENYGTYWTIDHTIACAWYDHDDADDRKNCWSRLNLMPMLRFGNQSKGVTLPSDDVLLPLKSVWPKSWNGMVPSKEERLAFYRRTHPRSKCFARVEV